MLCCTTGTFLACGLLVGESWPSLSSFASVCASSRTVSFLTASSVIFSFDLFGFEDVPSCASGRVFVPIPIPLPFPLPFSCLFPFLLPFSGNILMGKFPVDGGVCL